MNTLVKKALIGLTTVTVSLTTLNIPVFASTGSNTVSAVTAGAQVAYESNVISQMAGRCGAATPSGAKGIVFEIMDKDLMNFKQILTPGVKTQLTKSPNATAVDLVTTQNGKVVERVQCKNILTENGMNALISDIENGDYHSTQIHGTTESAKLFNKKASKAGISKKAVDTGISAKDTIRVADKSLGHLTANNIANAATKAGAAGALIGGSIAAVYSIANGQNIYDTVSNVAVSTTTGAIAGAGAATVGEVATAGLVAASTSHIFLILVPTGAAIGTGIVIDLILEDVSDDAKVWISSFLRTSSEYATARISDIQQAISESEIPSKASDIVESAQSSSVSLRNTIGQKISELHSSASSQISDIMQNIHN